MSPEIVQKFSYNMFFGYTIIVYSNLSSELKGVDIER